MLSESATAVVNAASKADLCQPVRTQGHILRSGDLLATLIVEVGVHHLDLVGTLDRAGPSPATLEYAREAVDGLLGVAAGAEWNLATYVLAATGRSRLTDGQRAELGDLAARFPVFG
jgi:hypothetical protein